MSSAQTTESGVAVRSILFLSLALGLFGAAAHASCTSGDGSPESLLRRIEIEACEPADDYANRIIEGTPFRWLHAPSAKTGIVITGKAVLTLGVWGDDGHGNSTGDEVDADTETHEWFLAARGSLSCKSLEAGETIDLHQTFDCCDTIPPSSYGCFFRMRKVALVPAELEGRLPPAGE